MSGAVQALLYFTLPLAESDALEFVCSGVVVAKMSSTSWRLSRSLTKWKRDQSAINAISMALIGNKILKCPNGKISYSKAIVSIVGIVLASGVPFDLCSAQRSNAAY